jgi:peroxiredoxin
MQKFFYIFVFLAGACGNSSQDAPPAQNANAMTMTSTSGSARSGFGGAAPEAEVGKPAPDFSLRDVDGKSYTLAQFRGKTVVLEWFNPNCPFVSRNHTKGPLKDMAAKAQEQGIVWLAINSNGPGKEGYGVDNNKAGIAAFHMVNPVLIDADGKVGHAYGARTTPHMFVIDGNGVVVYRGAIDNAQDGEPEQGAPFVNYVDRALGDMSAKRPIAMPDTKSYGCSVKYVP